MTPEANIPSNNPSLGDSMFGGNNQPQPQQESPQSSTGMAKSVSSVRTALQTLAKDYPEFSEFSDKTIQKLIDVMYKSMTKTDNKEGKEGG